MPTPPTQTIARLTADELLDRARTLTIGLLAGDDTPGLGVLLAEVFEELDERCTPDINGAAELPRSWRRPPGRHRADS